MTQTIEITSLTEARRAKLAQYTGHAADLKLNGMPVSGIITAVDRCEDTWLVRMIPLETAKDSRRRR